MLLLNDRNGVSVSILKVGTTTSTFLLACRCPRSISDSLLRSITLSSILEPSYLCQLPLWLGQLKGGDAIMASSVAEHEGGIQGRLSYSRCVIESFKKSLQCTFQLEEIGLRIHSLLFGTSVVIQKKNHLVPAQKEFGCAIITF